MYAALAARHGYRVAVLGQGARPSLYRRQGFVFPRTGTVVPVLEHSPVVARVFRDLSMAMEMRNRPRILAPSLQVVTPEMRLDLLQDPHRWERELDRELPEDGRVLLAFDQWADIRRDETDGLLMMDEALPPPGFRAGSRYEALVESYVDVLTSAPEGAGIGPLGASPVGSPLRAVVDGVFAHRSGLATSSRNPLIASRLWSHLRAGLRRFPEGVDGLKGMFLDKLKEQCGDHRPDAAVEDLVLRRGKVHEVVLADRAERLGCEILVVNMDPLRFLQMVPPEARDNGTHSRLAANSPVAWKMVINLGVDPVVVPEGMGPEVLMIADPSAPLVGDNCLWISRPGHVTSAESEGRPGPGVLSVTALLTGRGLAPTVTSARRLVDQVVTRVSELVPWLRDHLKVVDAPAIVEDAHGQVELDLGELTPIMPGPVPMTLELSPYEVPTGYKNVLLSGDGLFGGLGIEGTSFGALQTLAWTRRMLRLKSSLDRRGLTG